MLSPTEGNAPLVIRQTNLGALLCVDPLAFDAWWNAIHPDDQQSFNFHRGTESDAKFCCAYDYLSGRNGGLKRSQAIIEAWAAATEQSPRDGKVQIQAGKAWERDAVIDLLDRIQYRTLRVAHGRISLKYTRAMEDLLTELNGDVSIKDKVAVLDSVQKFLKQTSVEQQAERDRRTKRGVAKALDFIESKPELGDPSDEDLATLVKMAQAKLGPGKVQEILSE